MAEKGLKKFWSYITSQLIDRNSRNKSFVFLSTFIFTFGALGCLIVDFITNETTLGFISLGCFICFFVLEILQAVIFTKYKEVNANFLAIPVSIILAALIISYLFLAPPRSLYVYWICIVPICLFLTFDFKRAFIDATILFIVVLLIFYVPPLYQLTRTENIQDHWLMKAFFVTYYAMCSMIGVALAYVNIAIIKKLDELKEIYYQDANTDSLTGLRNQTYYLTYVNNLNKTAKKGESIGLMFIDIDDFKIYNDKFGHTVGNEVLVGVANKLNEVPHALCVRWGGDEFAIVEKNLTKDEFLAKANYLLKSVEALPHHITISIGLAYYVVDDNFDFQTIFNEADLRNIRAKGKGKNCIVFSE